MNRIYLQPLPPHWIQQAIKLRPSWGIETWPLSTRLSLGRGELEHPVLHKGCCCLCFVAVPWSALCEKSGAQASRPPVQGKEHRAK